MSGTDIAHTPHVRAGRTQYSVLAWHMVLRAHTTCPVLTQRMTLPGHSLEHDVRRGGGAVGCQIQVCLLCAYAYHIPAPAQHVPAYLHISTRVPAHPSAAVCLRVAAYQRRY
eukprot:3442508-Rhodomonas_salina.6